MFIRKYKNTSKKTGKTYNSFAIVDSVRLGDSIVQKVILNLGSNFDLPQNMWSMLLKKVKKYLYNEQSLFEISFYPEYDILAKDIADKIIAKDNQKLEKETVNIDSDILKTRKSEINGEDFRTAGPEHVSLHGAERLGLLEALSSLNIGEEKARIGLASVIARMVHPGSERETFRWLSNDSSLCELLGIGVNSENSLHRAIDVIYENKGLIETKVYDKLQGIFSSVPKVTFYDLTNTFFEGQPVAEKAKRGHSKEKRSDCPLVTLGCVLDERGFVMRSEIFPGNVSEPSTLETMLAKLKATKVGQVVMDKGIATAENIKWLNEHNYSYVVVSREQKRVFDFSKAKPIQTKSKAEVLIYKEITEDQSESRLYCYSENRSLKESAIWGKKASQFETELKKIDQGLSKPRCQKDKNVIERRIGRLFQRWAGISQHYKVNVEDNSSIKGDKEPLLATKVNWEKHVVSGTMMEQPGVYCIRSNNLSVSAEEMWRTYSQLTDIEAVFRSLKSELGIRPIYHTRPDRIESHVFIAVLAYQCVQIIRSTLKSSGINDSWQTIRNSLATHGRFTITFPNVERNKLEAIRKAMKPNSKQADIYRALRITNSPGGVIFGRTIPQPTTK
ncbi:MAG: IS1634 family transposase [Zoogloeaceae bacterium]|jgi:transposase|nr:IS1634 family transposase [Zoogloeaceae bacterium]